MHTSETGYCGTRDKTDSEQATEYGLNILKCCLWQFRNVLHCVYLKFILWYSEEKSENCQKEKMKY